MVLSPTITSGISMKTSSATTKMTTRKTNNSCRNNNFRNNRLEDHNNNNNNTSKHRSVSQDGKSNSKDFNICNKKKCGNFIICNNSS